MKNALILLLSLMIALNVLSVSISAKNISESTAEKNLLGITDEEMSIINPDNKFYVLKLYSAMPIVLFADGFTIDEIEGEEAFYLITENWSDQDPRKIKIDGDKIKYDDNQYDYIIDWQVEFINEWPNILKSSELTRDIYDEIEVTRIYFLDGFDAYLGSCLYLITNKGDYVCYRDMYPCTDYYFMTVEEFREMSVKAMEELSEFAGLIMGAGYLSEIIDISPYMVEINREVEIPPEIDTDDSESSTNDIITVGETETTINDASIEGTEVTKSDESIIEDVETTTITGSSIGNTENGIINNDSMPDTTDNVYKEESTQENNTLINEDNNDDSGCIAIISSISIIIPAIVVSFVFKKNKKE